MVERQFDRKIKRIRTDNAKDFVNHEFQNFCTESGIIHETSCAYTPQQNDIAERRIGLVQEKGRALLIQSNAPLFLWGEAMLTATYLTNRTASHSLGNQSPLQLISQHIYPIKLRNDHPQRVFGCECYVHLYPNQTDRLSPKAIKCVFIGYSNVQKGYKCYFPSNKRIIVSCDVTFNELNMFYHKDPNPIETLAPNQKEFLLQPEISHTYIRISVPRNDNHAEISAHTGEPTDIDDEIQNFSKAPTYDQVYIRRRRRP